MKNIKKYFEANLKRWNELVDVNAKSKSYDLEGFKFGNSSLRPVEIEELGDVEGKTFLHMQCHFGMDTLSWARKGARVTGIDFSDKAIELAKSLSSELNIPAKFIQSNIYDIPNVINAKYDIVYTSYGVLCWLPDLYKWAEVIEYSLKPGGIFYVIDNHPFGNIIDENREPFQVGYDYFREGEPYNFNDTESYADPEAVLNNTSNFQWFHTISDILNSLLKANLEIEYLHEFPEMYFQMHPDLKKHDDGLWRFQTLKYSVPMIFSVKAKKKKT